MGERELDIDLDKGSVILQDYCIANEVTGKKECHSSNAFTIYAHDGNEESNGEEWYDASCFSCGQGFTKEQLYKSSHADTLGVSEGEVTVRKKFERKPKAVPMTMKEVVAHIKDIGYNSGAYRGIKSEYSQFFGHLTKVDNNGKVLARYYPETKDDKVTGYKCRNHPKDFRYGKLGLTGLSCQLAGQIKFKDYKNHRDILIVGGEEDLAAAYQMLRDNQIRKGQEDYAPMAVVSPTTGEGSAIKQIREQYDFLNQFENVILGLDNDEVGNAAMLAIAEVLPKDKVKIASWSGKDPNAMLQKGKEKQFMSDFYNSRPLLDSGIFSSQGLMPHIKEALMLPRISMPPYMSKLQEKTKGLGVIKNRIYNIVGITSCGKSTHINNMVYHCAFLPQEKTAVISLEATKGEYGVDILSLHLETNLYWKQADDVISYLDDPLVVEKANELFVDEYGESRFYVVDDRRGTVASLEELCETLRNKHGVTVIVIDVLTDLLRVTSNEEQAKHMNFQSNFVKSGVTIFNVLHTRKLENSKDGLPKKATEFDAYGSSIFVQKAAGNFIINRNKLCPDEDWIERNSTYVDVPKMRQGETGEAGVWLYDPETRQTYDREQFFIDHPDKLPAGYDLTVSSYDKEYYEEGGRGFKSGNSTSNSFTKKKDGLEVPQPDLMDNYNF